MPTIFSPAATREIDCADWAASGTKIAATPRFAGKWVISTRAMSQDGTLSDELLKARGYEFSGAGPHVFHLETMVGKKHWYKIFDTQAEAAAEWEALCIRGI